MSSQILYEEMMDAYLTSEVSPAEYVASVGVDGFNMDEVVEAYAKFMRSTEDDICIRFNVEDETVMSLEDGKQSHEVEFAEYNSDDEVLTFNTNLSEMLH